MKISKSQRSNLLFLIIIVLIFFTPLRGYIQVFVSKAKMAVFSPSIEKTENRVVVSNYDWQLKGINTNDYDFNNAKGKVVLVNFWATWCPPCRAEMPSLQNLYNDYKDKVEFVFVTNEESEKVTKYLDKMNYDLPSFNQYSNAPKEFPVSSIPATFLLDKQGSIVIDKVGPADWNSAKVRELLDELLEK